MQKKLAQSNLMYMTIMVDLIDIGVETRTIDSEYSFKKKFTELIYMNL